MFLNDLHAVQFFSPKFKSICHGIGTKIQTKVTCGLHSCSSKKYFTNFEIQVKSTYF